MPDNFRTGNWTLRIEPDGVTARLWFCGTPKSEALPYDNPALYDPESEDFERATAERDAANALLLRLRKGQAKTPVPVP